MTSAEIRQSFLDFFQEKDHTIVPSASLLPTSPNLLFTNAGMNQFVPFFLGAQKAPYSPPRAADTQKCIRAGGKHNDLEDVGNDSYHHTLFEMLGNWSFGDYFKEEAIGWAWELLVDRWKFPPDRLYATVYKPGEGDPSTFDQDAYDHWRALFEKAGLDPDVHIVDGDVKDNFWMMGDTGPCGPCSEIHMDLTPGGITKGSLVNADDSRCIEIWNLVFIQYNAEEDGSFHPLPARHVDTGMGFERVCAVMQGTENFTDFSKLPSNYDSDVFYPTIAKLEHLSGHGYIDIYPLSHEDYDSHAPDLKSAIAFRVIADHIRTLSFAIADGILPGNTDRNYVLRRILRRAVRYGRNLELGGQGKNFLPELVPDLVAQFGDVFPELRKRRSQIEETLEAEETSFNKTLDRGIKLFNVAAAQVTGPAFPAEVAFELYDTYGFPTDLTALMAGERGLHLDLAEVEKHMEAQRDRGRAAQQTETIKAIEFETNIETAFVGYEKDSALAIIHSIVDEDDRLFAIIDISPFYVEMGGQVGDTGVLRVGDEEIEVRQVVQFGRATALAIDRRPSAWREQPLDAELEIDTGRRRDVEKHHTATHIFHWALHEAVSADAAQQGSYVGPDRLRFDFNSKALNADQIREIEKRTNAKIAADDAVAWTEVPHADVRGRKDIMQFFGDKYGDNVRVVQIGGVEGSLDGWSMELCGGTHVRKTGEIGLFKIRKEEAIAAGVRRIEAVCGAHAAQYLAETADALRAEIDVLHGKLSTTNIELEGAHAEPVSAPSISEEPYQILTSVTHDAAGRIEEIDAALDALTAHRDGLKQAAIEADKRLKKQAGASLARAADAKIAELIAASTEDADGATPCIVEQLEGADPGLLQEFLHSLKKKEFPGVAILAAPEGGKVHIGIYVAKERTGEFQAGKIMQELAPIVGGRGGGKPEMARGAGDDPSQIVAFLEKARALLT